MPDNNNNNNHKVFDKKKLVPTTTQVPEAGGDNHADINGSHAAWNKITDTSFINNLSFGQDQDLTGTADHVVNVQKNQIITIQEEQSTTAQRKITINSNKDEICINAATRITLKVGKSVIAMDSDGNIEITGVRIEINATWRTFIVGQNRVEINPRGSEKKIATPDLTGFLMTTSDKSA